MSMRRTAFLGILACVGCAATACSGSDAPPAADASSTHTAPSTSASSSSPKASSSTDSASSTGPAPSRSSSAPPSKTHHSCAATAYEHLSAKQRVGQLVMVGLDARGSRSTVGSLITDQHVGNVVYLGGWQGVSRVSSTSGHLQDRAGESATGGVGLLIAADQEGGQVQQLKGPGFTSIPSALAQGNEPPTTLQRNAATVGRQLKAAGVNVNLAPVADTVPTSIGNANAPIGRYNREYGHTPAAVSKAIAPVVRGLHQGGVAATLKHFPGIGRITGNTDVSATGITDSVMTRHDSYLLPFATGIKAGADLVMIGFARYPKIDGSDQAAFSHPIITGMLRGDLGFKGVVISDDLNAVAVRGTPEGQRAVRFIAAGGDIALTGATASAPVIVAAILSRSAKDENFATKVNQSVHRVLALKAHMGLLPCSKK